MARRQLRTRLALILFAGCLTGCFVDGSTDHDDASLDDGAADPDGFDPYHGYEEPDRDERLRLLRQDHPFDDEGKSCAIDANCTSPLRCLDEGRVCAFPPAMTGQVDETTPYALITTSGGAITRVFLEINDDARERARGMMDRQMVSEDFGMLFVFDEEAPRSFWMKNTYVPLDMIFIADDGAVDSIVANAQPLTTTSRRSDGPAKYVLELAGGQTEARGISKQSVVTIVRPEQ